MADLLAENYEKYLPLYARGRLLDLGCGKVPLYAAYKAYVAEAVCVDWENSAHANEYLDLYCDLTRTLPFEAHEFDTILLSDVLEHVPRPQHLWDEMARILSRNGHVIMNVPFLYWLHECPHDYYRYTEFALRRFVENSGLKLIELSAIGGAPEVVADILAKNAVLLPKIGAPIAASVQWLTRRLLKTRLGKRISARTAASFPIGYFVIAEKAG